MFFLRATMKMALKGKFKQTIVIHHTYIFLITI